MGHYVQFQYHRVKTNDLCSILPYDLIFVFVRDLIAVGLANQGTPVIRRGDARLKGAAGTQSRTHAVCMRSALRSGKGM